MCLIIDHQKTEKKLAQSKEYFTFYKAFCNYSYRDTFCLRTQYREAWIDKPIVSVRKRSIAKKIINGRALHAWVSRSKEALRFTDLLVPIKVKKEDIIAFGKNNDVAIASYTIQPIVWKRLIKYTPESPEVVQNKLNRILKKKYSFDHGSHLAVYDREKDIKAHDIDKKSSIGKKLICLHCAFSIEEVAEKILNKIKKIKKECTIFINYNTCTLGLGAVIYEV